MLARMKRLAKDLYQAYQYWQEDDGSHMAASVSFYMAVSFFPLLLVLISATGLVLRFTGWGQNVRRQLFDLIADQTAPTLANQVEAVLSGVEENAAVGGPIGLLILFVTSMAVFVHFDDAMNRIWNVPRPSQKGFLAAVRRVLIDRLRAFVMLFAVGAFVLVGFLASMGLSVVTRYTNDWLPMPEAAWSIVTLAAAVGLNWLLFIVIYKALPEVSVRWSAAARGAFLAAALWEAGRRLLAALVIGSKFDVYGIVGAFVAIMLWVFYAMTVLFVGAEYIQVYNMRREAETPTGQATPSNHDA